MNVMAFYRTLLTGLLTPNAAHNGAAVWLLVRRYWEAGKSSHRIANNLKDFVHFHIHHDYISPSYPCVEDLFLTAWEMMCLYPSQAKDGRILDIMLRRSSQCLQLAPIAAVHRRAHVWVGPYPGSTLQSTGERIDFGGKDTVQLTLLPDIRELFVQSLLLDPNLSLFRFMNPRHDIIQGDSETERADTPAIDFLRLGHVLIHVHETYLMDPENLHRRLPFATPLAWKSLWRSYTVALDEYHKRQGWRALYRPEYWHDHTVPIQTAEEILQENRMMASKFCDAIRSLLLLYPGCAETLAELWSIFDKLHHFSSQDEDQTTALVTCHRSESPDSGELTAVESTFDPYSGDEDSSSPEGLEDADAAVKWKARKVDDD